MLLVMVGTIIFGAKYLIWVLVGLALVWFLRQPKEKKKEMIVFGAVAFPLIYAVAKLIAMFYYNPRPFVVEPLLHPLIPHEPDNGFPSDHTLLGSAISTVIYSFSKKISILSWILTILVGLSRILAGIHHPIDILGSIIISILVGLIVYHVFFSRFNQRGN